MTGRKYYTKAASGIIVTDHAFMRYGRDYNNSYTESDILNLLTQDPMKIDFNNKKYIGDIYYIVIHTNQLDDEFIEEFVMDNEAMLFDRLHNSYLWEYGTKAEKQYIKMLLKLWYSIEIDNEIFISYEEIKKELIEKIPVVAPVPNILG